MSRPFRDGVVGSGPSGDRGWVPSGDVGSRRPYPHAGAIEAGTSMVDLGGHIETLSRRREGVLRFGT
jgi:hypothetical protein